MDVAAPLNSPFYRNSFLARFFSNTALFSSRQQHSEIEMVFVKGAYGSATIGDNELIFTGEPQLIIIGAYIPHVWHLRGQKGVKMSVYSFHFNSNLFGELLFLPEMSRINDLFMSFYKGIEVDGDCVRTIDKDVIKVYKANPVSRLILLLELLNKISIQKNNRFIVSEKYNLNCSQKDGVNLRKIYRYVCDHYEDEITLEEVSRILKITKESFSRYFGNKANITFSEYLIETRIGFARQMLLNNTYSVNEIAQKCGYRSISNFFQHFKSICGSSPQAYQKQYRI